MIKTEFIIKIKRMLYKIRQKIMSIGDTFSIKDNNGNKIFIVKSQILSIGKKLKIYNLYNEELIYIEQKLLTLLPEYHIFENKVLIAKAKKEFTFFKPKINIELQNETIKIKGDIFDYNYSIKNKNKNIASINKDIINITDNYTVNINDDENQLLILSLIIVIDMIFHEN